MSYSGNVFCLSCFLTRLIMAVGTLVMYIFFSPTGSGSLAAMAVFEDRYKPDMEVILPLVYFIQFN